MVVVPPMDIVDDAVVAVLVAVVVVAAGIVVADIADTVDIAVADIVDIAGISAGFVTLYRHYRHRYHVPMPESLDLESSIQKIK